MIIMAGAKGKRKTLKRGQLVLDKETFCINFFVWYIRIPSGIRILVVAALFLIIETGCDRVYFSDKKVVLPRCGLNSPII